MANILLINGPNLNRLGQREPDKYGTESLADIEIQLQTMAKQSGHSLIAFQSNHEGEIVDKIHQAEPLATDASSNSETLKSLYHFILINPAAYTHTSVAIRDALSAVATPFIEIHLSNIYGRESFRKCSYFSDIAEGVISGLGPLGYELALQAAMQYLEPV